MKSTFFDKPKMKLNANPNDQCIIHAQYQPNKETWNLVMESRFQFSKKLPYSFKKNQQTQLERPNTPHNRTQDLVDKAYRTNHWYLQKEIGIHENRIVVDNYGFVINEDGSNENLKW
ncbi:hypothetical protein M0812_20210 [Anaeramoeba flamelloides]|uniref:Uncharacterized protein n=1 Tax=Anaeramoeba flamelloides TaxID=1746091 RepID=A0AAV7Z0M9_9EUKA|nr:hypothetical protein M0812_20210 [Anaeramoeba flamelloides]